MKTNSFLFQLDNFKFTYPQSKSMIAWDGEHKIFPGEKILLSGDSGSGKSTLLYGLMGFIPEVIYGSVKGDICFKGNSIISNPEFIKGKAGLILQNPSAQMLCKSVYEELAFGLENKQLQAEDIKDIISHWTDRFRINHLINRNTETLSGGEKQKIALISILMTQPEVLMLDEPTAFLDPDSAQEIIDIIKNSYLDKSLIFVEHNLSYLKHIITRNLHLESNGNVQDRQPDKIVWQQPLPSIPPPHPRDEILSLQNISFSYSDIRLLSGINLKIHQGEIITIRGKNGAGKSTLLQIISGLLKPQSGNILIKNHKNDDRKALKHITGILFQNPENHFMFNTIEKELSFILDNSLEHEFSPKSQQSPFTLSEGEKRRLSIMIACQSNKKILLLDEPTFGQDYNNKKKLIALLEKLRDAGIAIVIVSHDLPFIKAVGSKHFHLKDSHMEREA